MVHHGITFRMPEKKMLTIVIYEYKTCKIYQYSRSLSQYEPSWIRFCIKVTKEKNIAKKRLVTVVYTHDCHPEVSLCHKSIDQGMGVVGEQSFNETHFAASSQMSRTLLGLRQTV